ncbi:MAG: RNA pseudouridine synthase, partial [Oscillospiraceae bacterium]|nr:RNA pseudouridine synthase [Oscillospiraceae bacterium]
MNEFVIPIENKGERLDKFISSNEEFDLTRTAVQNLITEGMITVNGKKIAKNYVISGGETVSVEIPEPVVLDVLPENIPIDIVYEDDYLLVVNKPKGMVVHPAAGNYTGTLVNALMYHCKDRLSSINGVIRPGIVHRIDKNTSGLLIVAKTDSAHLGLAEQIKEHSFTREYETIIVGRM